LRGKYNGPLGQNRGPLVQILPVATHVRGGDSFAAGTHAVQAMVNFINVLRLRFFVQKHVFDAKILYESASRNFVIFGTKILSTKSRQKMLMKLIPIVTTPSVKIAVEEKINFLLHFFSP
jgi:hypothetical protein